jgi:quercetin dioxygenase-like cupin family protein
MSRNLQAGCDTNEGVPENGTMTAMEIKRYADIAPFEYADIQLRELTPSVFKLASFAEVVLSIGIERSERQSAKDHRIYLCLRGEIEFTVEGETFRLGVGDVLHIDKGETYRFHNGGYEEGRLLLLRVPGPELPESAQP